MTNRSNNQIGDRAGATHATSRTPETTSEDHIARAMRVLMDREWPGPNPPDRNHRIEEAIMAGSIKSVSKRHLWAGGVLLLLAGSAIGAVATNIITQRFTGYVELEDGSRVAVQGELMIQEDGENKEFTVSVENLPEGQVVAGEWVTEDGQRIRVEPLSEGHGAMLTVPADGAAAPAQHSQTPPAPAKPADKEPEAKKSEDKKSGAN